jgi:hypothetical protein
MISMTKTRLGARPCPVVGYVGSGAKAALGGGVGLRWPHRLVSQDQSVLFVRTADQISTVDNSTGLSAPPQRSP